MKKEGVFQSTIGVLFLGCTGKLTRYHISSLDRIWWSCMQGGEWILLRLQRWLRNCPAVEIGGHIYNLFSSPKYCNRWPSAASPMRRMERRLHGAVSSTWMTRLGSQLSRFRRRCLHLWYPLTFFGSMDLKHKIKMAWKKYDPTFSKNRARIACFKFDKFGT